MKKEELLKRERPVRILNKIIIGFPKEQINDISEYTATYLRPVIKLPMILILFVTGFNTGLNLVGFAFLGELL